MHLILTIIFILCLLVLAYFLALKPDTKRQAQMIPFQKTYIAHRGFFDNSTGYPENSLIAFSRAVDAGYGAELDVQLTKDGKLVVFHDDTLKRMCGVNKKISACTYEELCTYYLLNTEQKIPLLTEVLTLVDGKIPLIIEIKFAAGYKQTAAALAEIIKSYQGIYCMESFHPGALLWYRRHEPQVLRGQLSTNFKKNHIKAGPLVGFILTNLLLNWCTKPDFIAYNHKYAEEFSYRVCRWLYPVVNAAWTIRSQEELERARKIFTVFIFDGFTPR